ncbi:hypothetical protein B0H13DRAFT_1866567 [Mycena leptocephala]|nr:hypothetical protein B0H13DRAFT_1866567 [Mycena leptocephala]
MARCAHWLGRVKKQEGNKDSQMHRRGIEPRTAVHKDWWKGIIPAGVPHTTGTCTFHFTRPISVCSMNKKTAVRSTFTGVESDSDLPYNQISGAMNLSCPERSSREFSTGHGPYLRHYYEHRLKISRNWLRVSASETRLNNPLRPRRHHDGVRGRVSMVVRVSDVGIVDIDGGEEGRDHKQTRRATVPESPKCTPAIAPTGTDKTHTPPEKKKATPLRVDKPRVEIVNPTQPTQETCLPRNAYQLRLRSPNSTNTTNKKTSAAPPALALALTLLSPSKMIPNPNPNPNGLSKSAKKQAHLIKAALLTASPSLLPGLAGKEGMEEKRRKHRVHSDPSRVRPIEWERDPLYERADQAPHPTHEQCPWRVRLTTPTAQPTNPKFFSGLSQPIEKMTTSAGKEAPQVGRRDEERCAD